MAPPSQVDRWVLRFHPNPHARRRLFCLPFAGGSASTFRTWSTLLPADVEVCAIQPPGRESRIAEAPFTQLATLVQTLAYIIQPYLALPFALFGHSLGALVAFELTRQLRREQLPEPRQLFVSARRAPQLAETDAPIHQLPDAEFVQELRRYNGTPEAVLRHAELLALLLPVLRADFALHETYVYLPEPPLDCPIVAFGGLEDPLVQRDDLTAWRTQTRQRFDAHLLPGDHFFINNPRALLGLLSQKLADH